MLCTVVAFFYPVFDDRFFHPVNAPSGRWLGRIMRRCHDNHVFDTRANKGIPMTQPYSARSRAIEPFHVMALLARANELQAAGHDVIHLEIGEPDFTTAEPIIKAGQAALADGKTRYTAARGLPQLREAIAGFYAQRYQLDIDPQRILVTPGGSGALLLASS
ncbi:Uncharacterized protein ALO72_04666, partial [Pseudomonas syringae pv. delphinii]